MLGGVHQKLRQKRQNRSSSNDSIQLKGLQSEGSFAKSVLAVRQSRSPNTGTDSPEFISVESTARANYNPLEHRGGSRQ